MHWRFDLTEHLVPRHRQQLVWAMQRQDQRLQSKFRSGAVKRPPWTLIVLGVVGGTVLAAVAVSDPAALDHPVLLALGALVFAVAIVRGIQLSVRGPDAPGRAGRMTNRSIANIAERTFSKVKSTHVIEYELTGTQLRSRVASAGVDHTVDLATIKVAIATPDSIVLFRRRLSQLPKRIVYVETGDERAAVLAALTAATIETIDGPLEGYAPDGEIPRAIVR